MQYPQCQIDCSILVQVSSFMFCVIKYPLLCWVVLCLARLCRSFVVCAVSTTHVPLVPAWYLVTVRVYLPRYVYNVKNWDGQLLFS